MNIVDFVDKSMHKGILEYYLTPDVYYSFQRCSGDFNPLHTDLQFAQKHGFQSQVMYGNILNAFVSHFVGMSLLTRNVVIQSQDINYHNPVYMNDKLEMRYSISNVSEAANCITYKFSFYREELTKMKLAAKGHVTIGLLDEV